MEREGTGGVTGGAQGPRRLLIASCDLILVALQGHVPSIKKRSFEGDFARIS